MRARARDRISQVRERERQRPSRKFCDKLWQFFIPSSFFFFFFPFFVNASTGDAVCYCPLRFSAREGTGGGGRIMLSPWIAAPLCAANSPRLNCPSSGVTCRYAAYRRRIRDFYRAMKNLAGVRKRSRAKFRMQLRSTIE